MKNDIKTDFRWIFHKQHLLLAFLDGEFSAFSESEALTIDFSGYSWGMFTDFVRS